MYSWQAPKVTLKASLSLGFLTCPTPKPEKPHPYLAQLTLRMRQDSESDLGDQAR